MRDELVAWLDSGEAAVAQMAGTRTLRLSQILAGFVGGVEDVEGDLLTEGPPASTIRDVGHAKLDAVAEFLAALNVHKAVVWCRFRPEMDRMASALEQRLGRAVHRLQGQQPPDERDAAKRAFAPGTASDAPALLVGHPAAGGAGLNFAAANVAVYATNPWSWKDRKQSEGRINRPGQTRPVRFVDVVAVGPDGQRTLDHTILRALRDNDDIANWTAETWRRALTDEQKGA
jgi:SNF2 family DNA or RNA helicase